MQNISRKCVTISVTSVLTLALAVMPVANAMEEFVPPENGDEYAEFIVKPNEGELYKKAKKGELFKKAPPEKLLDIHHGNAIAFTDVVVKEGQSLGYLASEFVMRGNRSVREDVPVLSNADPLVLFHALSEPGTRIPDGLIKAYGRPPTNEVQGWALPLIPDTGPVTYLKCSDSPNFLLAYNFEHVPWFEEHPYRFISIDDGPILKPNHWSQMTGGGLGGYSQLTGEAHNTRGFFVKVRLCSQDENLEEGGDGSFVDGAANPEFQLLFRGTTYPHNYWTSSQTQFNGYGLPASYYEDMSHYWHPIDKDIYSDVNEQFVDWRLQIRFAYGEDNFWLTASWDQPTETLKPNW